MQGKGRRCCYCRLEMEDMNLDRQEQSDEASCKRDPVEEPANEPVAKMRKTSPSETQSIDTLRARLESERDRLAEAEKTVEELKRMVKKTEMELQNAINVENGATGVVCGCRDILMSALLPFLDPVDLGRAGQVTRLWRDCCRDNRFWLDHCLERWISRPIHAVTNYWAFYRSQLTKRVYEESLTYPHYGRQTRSDSTEEYYVLYELPEIEESTLFGQRRVSRCVKIDRSLAIIAGGSQGVFEESLCTCERHDGHTPGVHESSFLSLPLDLTCNPFPTREIPQRVTQLKISILRTTDQKVALIMDPASDRYESSSDDDGNYPSDILQNEHSQALGEIPNHLDRVGSDDFDSDSQVSALSFRTRASIGVPLDGGFVGGDPEMDTWRESEELVQVRFTRVLLGFELYNPFTESDNAHHMAPPLVPESLTRFFEMAGVKWF